MSSSTTVERRCDACGRGSESTFLFQTRRGPIVECWRCALRHRPMLKRSLMIAAVIGMLRLAINQGDVVLRDEWPRSLAWKGRSRT